MVCKKFFLEGVWKVLENTVIPVFSGVFSEKTGHRLRWRISLLKKGIPVNQSLTPLSFFASTGMTRTSQAPSW